MTVTELRSRAVAAAPDSTGGRRRWRPTRAGIVNVWRYYEETFTFHQGRLLLRGPNGTGKSKAMELLLPFLFDASLRPNRLSTFGGAERNMHWNLMGEGAPGKTRVGYVWVEFGRETHAEPEWFTCGARLQASVHTSGAHADYFTTTQRVGEPAGLSLVTDSGAPLTRAALAEAIGGHGTAHESAADHRSAVCSVLFPELNEQRYEALITALLQLRTPKLSERLDPAFLSTLLSRALPPVGEGAVAELAEGFERLDRQREQVLKLDEEVTAATTVAAEQRGYARRVLRGAAASLISATTDMDDLTRVARQSEEEHTRAENEHAKTAERRGEVERRVDELEGAIEGLTGLDAYQAGRELDQLRSRTAEAARTAGALRHTADAALARAAVAAQRARDERGRAELQQEGMAEALADARRVARRAALDSVCEEMESMLAAEPTATPARALLLGATGSRRQQIGTVRGKLEDHERAVDAREAAERSLEEARKKLAEVIRRRDEATRDHEAAVDAQAERLADWARRCTELRFPDLDELTSRAAGETAVLALVEPMARAVVGAIAEGEATTRQARDTARQRRDALAKTVERLRREADLPPPVPHTRTADRSLMAGAPLWRLLSFRDDVPPADQAGIEAALEASGLLDAWVGPYDDVEVPGHDTLAAPVLSAPAPGASLLDVLRPEPGIPVPADRVVRLLRGVAYGPEARHDHPAAVGADGSWCLAAATGSWRKAEAAHIGAFARERARRRRVTELTEQLRDTEASLAAVEDELRAFARRRDRLDAELAERPDHDDVNRSQDSLRGAASDVSAVDGAVASASKWLTDREKAATLALRALAAVAAEYALPTGRAALDDVAAVIDTFRDVGDAWLAAHHAWTTARDAATTAEEHASETRGLATDQATTADEAETAHRRLAAQLQETERAVGADYREVLGRLAEHRKDRNRALDTTKALTSKLEELARRIGTLDKAREEDAERRDAAVGARDDAARRFREMGGLGFADDAGEPLSLTGQEGVRATLEAARHVSATWPHLAYSAKNLQEWSNRLSEAVHKARQPLGGRADLDLTADDNVSVFSASLDGVRLGAQGLLDALTTERDRSREDITAAERELFDQTLTGDTRRHLATRIRQANELVDRMNGHLAGVRTASRVAVRLVWQVNPDLPAGTKTARALLLKKPKDLTNADRDALHAFFRDRVEEARTRNTAASWEEHLSEVLDYTAWHRFVVKLDRANGAGWQLLTKKLHGALSGGEKAIALHLPLFAAVAAHYETVPEAPRLILLDEVFVGVDTTNRGQIFALLSALDLDLMLTSDHEWCTYREMPGIAIHQLITGDDGDDAVTSARFTWDGVDLLASESETSPA